MEEGWLKEVGGRALGEEAKGRGAAVDNIQCSQMARFVNTSPTTSPRMSWFQAAPTPPTPRSVACSDHDKPESGESVRNKLYRKV